MKIRTEVKIQFDTKEQTVFDELVNLLAKIQNQPNIPDDLYDDTKRLIDHIDEYIEIYII